MIAGIWHMKSIAVRYYAILRDQAGRRMEQLDTRAATRGDLFDEQAERHGLRLTRDALRVAINEKFGDWQQPLRSATGWCCSRRSRVADVRVLLQREPSRPTNSAHDVGDPACGGYAASRAGCAITMRDAGC